ncbi:DNA methyltransferase [Thauera sp.]|uniref:DNA methyltransferase n=1 Tax=Thauera sp. TaxID=1905334 RepID=UPI002B9F8B16|nr:DNA methyltransferase [Thauera sp.]HRP25378.1 DNA methyltransferase [Thauera sp.]
MSGIQILAGDNRVSLEWLPKNSIDAVVTDPPYLLTSIVERFGKAGSAPARTEKNDGSFSRLSGGFMNKQWDSPNVALPPMSAEFGHYMAGFVDGEGCFHVHKKQVNGCEAYDCQFSITLRADDRDILREMQVRLGGIGSLAERTRDGANPQVRYCISSKADCQILRAVLSTFPLRAKKARDFEIWCHALDAWVSHEPKSSWSDVAFYRDQLMLVKRFGSLYKPELLLHYQWASGVYRVLKPGGFVFAFSGARTGHWQACAMEQAGFIMHPMHAWLYGQGFPKGHDASKAIDKHLGVEGSKGGVKPGHADFLGRDNIKSLREGGALSGKGGYTRPWMFDPEKVESQHYTYLPGSPEAQAWDGWKYGTQTQKPAMEPIYLAQKPYDGKPVESILKWGVGAFNIDGCRVALLDGDSLHAGVQHSGGAIDTSDTEGEWGFKRVDRAPGLGRYPANVLHDGSDEVVALFPETKSGQLLPTHNVKASENGSMSGGNYAGRVKREFGGDSGSAARFFNSFPADDIPWPLAFYHSKAGKADRAGSKHPTVKPIGLLRHLIRHICPPGGTVLDPFAGSGTTAEAARLEGMACILMEQEAEYLAFLRKRFAVPAVSDPSDDKEDIFT